MKNIYIDNGAKNALKYVFQMNEKENKVKTTNYITKFVLVMHYNPYMNKFLN